MNLLITFAQLNLNGANLLGVVSKKAADFELLLLLSFQVDVYLSVVVVVVGPGISGPEEVEKIVK